MNPITLFWKGIATIAAGISLVFGGAAVEAPQNLGADIPVTVAVFESSLAAPILTTSATSFTLVNGTDKAGNALSGLIGFVINEGASNEEFVLCTASSTAVSGCTRGISPVTGNTAVAALAKTHRRGESVKITDHPQLAIVSRVLNGDETLPNPLKYSTTTPAYITSAEQLTHKGYVDGIVIAGGVPADNSTPGISRIATPQNLAEGTANLGVYAYSAPSTAFNATSSATTTVPVTKSNGKLSQGFLDLTEPFTFSGGVTSTGVFKTTNTTTLATTTVNGVDVGSKLSQFGGTGADGALNITTGTTTIDLAGAAFVTKNYTSISITGDGKLAFSNPAAGGTVVILKSQGNVTITSTDAAGIDLRLMGAAKGTNASAALQPSTTAYQYYGTVGSGAADVAGGLQYVFSQMYRATGITATWAHKPILIAPGSGGGDSASGQAGGRGAGALYIECGGALNFGAAATINASGQDGVSASAGSQAGGGGASGGMVVILYNSLTANSGTINTAGGKGGNSQLGANLTGGAGAGSLYAAGGLGKYAGNGQNAPGNSAGGGGAGASGGNSYSGGTAGPSAGGLVTKNTEF